MENKSLKIGILGLGLIGGSILKALFLLNKYTLFAVSNSSYKSASEYCNVCGCDINILKSCDIVFVCTKMNKTKVAMKNLEKVVSKNTLVADVCSLKSFLDDDYKFNYIPTHPMAGSEFCGFENSDAYLFEGAKWILGKKNQKIIQLIEEMGAKPYILNAGEHDLFAAEISHLPTLLSFALFESARDDSKKIASSGFRDCTRLAITNQDLAFDMLNFNRENIMKAYKKLDETFKKIIALDEADFKKKCSEISKKRSEMYNIGGKNTL